MFENLLKQHIPLLPYLFYGFNHLEIVNHEYLIWVCSDCGQLPQISSVHAPDTDTPNRVFSQITQSGGVTGQTGLVLGSAMAVSHHHSVFASVSPAIKEILVFYFNGRVLVIPNL